MNGKQLEAEILRSIKSSPKLTGDRYGVKMSFRDGEFRPIKSNPDIEGLIAPKGRQFVIEAKTLGTPSLFLATRIRKDKTSQQLKKMFERSAFGGVCCYVIHWNERQLKTKYCPPRTFAFPVHPCDDFWRAFVFGVVTKITVDDCVEHAIEIEWEVGGRVRTPRMNLVSVIEKLDARINPVVDYDWRKTPVFVGVDEDEGAGE